MRSAHTSWRDSDAERLLMPTEELERYIADFGTRHGLDEVERTLDEVRALRVLLVGEAIVDEYVYCETMGKAGKEPVLAARYVSREKFAGGILAVANHVAALSDHVSVITLLGDGDPHETFIRERVNPKVDLRCLTAPGAQTILKRRYIEVYPPQKLFELYVMGDSGTEGAQSPALRSALQEALPEFDVVVIADYGHGMLDADVVQTLCAGSRFLAVNTQVNADNRGFNTVSKYPRADYVCVSEMEIRLEARSRQRDLREIVVEVAGRLSCPRILVTRGKEGCLFYDRVHGFVDVPAFTTHVVDRIGAGDAVLAVTALCAAQGAPAEVVAAIGNAVGAQAVAAVGNSRAVDPLLLVRELAALLPA